MIDGDLVDTLLRQLEQAYNVPVQLKIEPLQPGQEFSPPSGHYLGDFFTRTVTVKPVAGTGREYEIASHFAGTHTVRGLLTTVEDLFREYRQGDEAPMNILRFSVRSDGIYAVVNGVYGPSGHLEVPPGFEGNTLSDRPFHLKVANLELHVVG